MSPMEVTETTVAPPQDVELRAADGLLLRGRWWRRQAPRGVIVVVHGFGEHGGAYRRVAEQLRARLEVDVVAVDFRGHGQSAGRRGVVGRYDDLVGDLETTLEWAGRQFPELDRFVLAHSNGGQVALRTVLGGRMTIEALVVSNPLIRVMVPVPPAKLRLGRVLAVVAPWLTLKGELNVEALTRDPEIQVEHQTDPLRHSRMSAPLYFGMLAGGDLLLAQAHEIHTPILMLLGGSDTVLDPKSSREFFDRLGSDDKTLLYYPTMVHEPLNDLGREQVVDDVVRWLSPRLPG
jgi:alpha-beta hydrolase superfamily lysophospholipase